MKTSKEEMRKAGWHDATEVLPNKANGRTVFGIFAVFIDEGGYCQAEGSMIYWRYNDEGKEREVSE